MLPFACRLPLLCGWLVSAALMTTPTLAAESYRLQSGDMIDFALLGAAPVSRKIMVDQDGLVSIPMGGSFPAAGRTLEELREAVTQTLKTVSYPAGVDAQGATVWNVIYPESVLIEIAEYRPIYVSGDVLTPSAQPFRSGMTVAQAVAVAGGASAFRARQDYSIERAGLEEEEGAAYVTAFRSGLEVARIEAELQGKPAPDFSALPAAGIDPALADSLRSIETERFNARRDDMRKSRDTLETNIATSKSRLDVLKASQSNLEAETRNYEDEVKRVEALLRKGLIQIDRLTTAQRGVFLVSTRSLDTSAAVAQSERDLLDLRRQLTKLDDTMRLDNLAALQTASANAAEAEAKIDALRMKARVVSGVGEGAQDLRYFVTGRDGDALVRREAQAETVLQPGDLVEVVLGAPSSRQSAADPQPMKRAARDAGPADAAEADVRSGVPTPSPAAR